ncbi:MULTISPECIES: YdaS family helix-turn-helix protein [unclassified Xanthomonas]|uniref:transcriptional regulator n=1 Tax=unclassified Xanthomonas TaxID=2643310 RepID=UPI002A827C4E|nr:MULTISPECIES: YdaS family helix-turn-helix protein [unclassified Xanthomonas]MDY4297539.1 YdaS family helix-turn-helix protein [Xanthomonas sp. LF02-5]MDY4359333.1 YdaS family helix-turn-helix protein [Xanthomonas sp. LF04-12]
MQNSSLEQAVQAIGRAVQAAGGQSRFAAAIGVSPQAVAPYFKRGLSPERCPAAEKATGVRCEELRPDLHWIRKRGRVIGYTVLLPQADGDKSTQQAAA